MNSIKISSNPLICDPVQGLCEIPGAQGFTQAEQISAQEKPVRIIYFTDPICSSCWGIEPQLRRFKLEYGHLVDIQYHMGGLLPGWDGFRSGGITQPTDVAHHWDEVSQHYQMPIDGDIWLEDPLPSSYPPSIAFKAAQMQDEHKAVLFLRKIREMVFLEKKNITKWEYLAAAATQAGLDPQQMKVDMEGPAKQKFQQDLELGKMLGVRGFPTIFMANQAGQQLMVYGVKPFAAFEQTLIQLYPETVKSTYSKDLPALLAHYPTLCTREFAELSGKSTTEATTILQEAQKAGVLKVHATKNGPLWIKL